MNKDDTKQAIIGFMEFTKGITGNKDLKIPEDIAKEYGIEQDDTSDNLCDSCSNYGCEFQSGIIRTKCAFYMPPHIEPDNCGNYVVQPTYEARLKADTVVILDKIRSEVERYNSIVDDDIYEGELKIEGMKEAYADCLKIIDKYKGESEE